MPFILFLLPANGANLCISSLKAKAPAKTFFDSSSRSWKKIFSRGMRSSLSPMDNERGESSRDKSFQLRELRHIVHLLAHRVNFRNRPYTGFLTAHRFT